MKTVNVKNFIMTIDNMISSETCNIIVDAMTEESTFKKNTIVDNREGRKDTQFDGDMFLQHLSRVQENGVGGEPVGDIISNCLQEGCDLYCQAFVTSLGRYIKSSIIEFTEFKFQETPIGGGFHDWHFENTHNSLTDRRFLVWSIFLNDVEEGGELEFLNYPVRVKPKKGSMVLFPPYFTHLHRGNPPISNNKYIATGWYYVFHR